MMGFAEARYISLNEVGGDVGRYLSRDRDLNDSIVILNQEDIFRF